jgi:hypothetical protein
MDQRIKNLFNEEILQKAMHRYGIGKDEIQVLDSFESFIYVRCEIDNVDNVFENE